MWAYEVVLGLNHNDALMGVLTQTDGRVRARGTTADDGDILLNHVPWCILRLIKRGSHVAQDSSKTKHLEAQHRKYSSSLTNTRRNRTF